MSLKNKTDDEVFALARELCKYHESGPILKELVSRCQSSSLLVDELKEQLNSLAADAEIIRLHSLKQADASQGILNLLATNAQDLSPQQALTAAALAEKLGLTPTLERSINQIRAEELRHISPLIVENVQRHNNHFGLPHYIRAPIGKRIAELLYYPIGPVPVERDLDGKWSHPAYAMAPDWDEGTPSAEIQEWFASHNLETSTVDLESQNEDLFEKYMDEPADADLNDWEPTPPHGDGWFLFCIFDTEDGVYAEFARQLISG